MCQGTVLMLRRHRRRMENSSYELQPRERNQCTHTQPQQRYKHNHDRRGREILVFLPNSYVFIDNPLLRLSTDNYAGAIPTQPYHKLQPQTSRPFVIITVRKKTLTIDEQGTAQTVLMTHAPEPNSTNHLLHSSSMDNKSRINKNPQREVP